MVAVTDTGWSVDNEKSYPLGFREEDIDTALYHERVNRDTTRLFSSESDKTSITFLEADIPTSDGLFHAMSKLEGLYAERFADKRAIRRKAITDPEQLKLKLNQRGSDTWIL